MSYADPARQRAYNLAYNATNKEAVRAGRAAYRAANAESLRAQKAAYRERQRDATRAHAADHRARIAELKSGPCMDCGRSFHHSAMDFDHVRGVKVKNISLMTGRAWDSILEEIAKCDLVCANCHRVRTFMRHRGGRPRLVA